MWYIDEGFLIWIIPLTYLSREPIIWACTTSFVHKCIYHMFNLFITCLIYLLHVYVYLCSPYCFLCMLSDSDLLIYMIYYRSCKFPLCYLLLLVPACLDHITWSCTRVPVMHAIRLYYMCSLGLLTTLDSHVQILKSSPWWSCCSWSECAADPPVEIGVQQKLGHCHSSSSQLFSYLALKVPLAARERLSAFVMYISSCIVLLYFSGDIIFL